MTSLPLLVLLSISFVNSFNVGQPQLSCTFGNILSIGHSSANLPSNNFMRAMDGGTASQLSSSKTSNDEMPFDIISDMIGEADTIFDSIDVNKDGQISNDELQSHLEKNGYSTESIRNLFTALDKNADGIISREEMQFAFYNYEATALFMAFGEGNDVSVDAYNDAVKDIRSSAKIDYNIAPELLTKLADLIFDMIDTDKSGAIDTQELRDFFRESGGPTYIEAGNTSIVSANNVFRALDIHSNSTISREEMRDGFKQYDPRVLSKVFGLRIARKSEV